MGLFAKATAKSEKPASKSKKSTTWIVGASSDDAAVATAIHELNSLSAQEKAIDAKKKMHATVVMRAAKENHVRDFASLGVPPDTPMVLQNTDGEKVTFVVQDRGGQYAVKPEQVEALNQLLGEDAAADLLYTEVTLSFDRTILGLPGVSEVVEKALEKAVGSLLKSGTLNEEQADNLITAGQKTAFKPGTLDRAAMVCGRDVSRLSAFLDAMGASCTRYVKV